MSKIDSKISDTRIEFSALYTKDEMVPLATQSQAVNPFTLLPHSYYRMGRQPVFHEGRAAVAVMMGVDL